MKEIKGKVGSNVDMEEPARFFRFMILKAFKPNIDREKMVPWNFLNITERGNWRRKMRRFRDGELVY